MDELQAISLQIPQEHFQTLILLVVMIVFTKDCLDQRFDKPLSAKTPILSEQAFWLSILNPISKQIVVQPTPVKIEVPSELPKDFDHGLHNEVKTVFNQMEAVVEQCSVDKKCFEIQKKELYLENDRLLQLIISQDLVHTAINSLEVIDEWESMRKSWCEEYNRNLTLEAELLKMNELSKTCSRLQNNCISLELKLQ
ncbi:hypothetical protein Tco_0512531 [Tanacetum coccineum]